MEAERGTGLFSSIRVKYVGTTAPTHPVKCRYILEYGPEKVWTDLMPIDVTVGGEQVLTPELPELLKRLAVAGGNEFKLTMSFFEVPDVGRKKRLPILEDPIIIVTCKKGTFPVTQKIEGPGTISFKGAADLNAVLEGTLLTVIAKPDEGNALLSLEANGRNILATKSFRVTSPTEVKAVFGKLKTYKVTLKSNDNEYGAINLKEAVNPDAVPEGTKLHIEVRPNAQCELTKLMANDEDITETKSFAVTKDTEIVATFVNYSSVESVAAQQLRLYPNPARDYVLLEGIPAGATVAIYSLEGQLIYQAEAASDTLRISLTQLQEGTYILRVGDETRRLIVRR
jgi:hypothetical protein